MKRFTYGSILVILLLTAMAIFPSASAENNTTPMDPDFDWIYADYIAGPKDMSMYNKPLVVESVPTLSERTARLYPGMEVMDQSIVYKSHDYELDTAKSTMKQIALKFSDESTEGPSVTGIRNTARVQIPYVQPLSGYFTWYWEQDITVYHNVTIHNFGPVSASGRVIFTSLEDQASASTSFSNLAPNTSTTVTIPFQIVGSQSSVGIKPMALAVIVDPYDTITWAGTLPYTGVERYNNDASHLSDPDGGDNLETSDLYHFPFNEGYIVVLKAGEAGDNTSTPLSTAQKINGYVNETMTYTETYDYLLYAASDLKVIDSSYTGVCDEYATLDVSFSRALGIPTRFLGITWVNESGQSFGHAIAENWDSHRWVHSDPTWVAFDNPQIYKSGNNTHMFLKKYTDADDSRFTEDVTGDGLLRYEDMINQSLGELPEYN